MALGSIHSIHMCSMSIHEDSKRNVNVVSHATQSDDNYLASSFDKINCVQLLVEVYKYRQITKQW